MWRHPSDERLLELAEGHASPPADAHVAGCAQCRERVESARAGLRLAREADVLPEPSAVYWEAFRRRVDRQIVAERSPWSGALGWRPALAGAAGIAALSIALAPGLRAPGPEPSARTLPAWSALPPEADDVSLAMIGELEPSEEALLAASAGPGVASAVVELSDAERQQLALALQQLLASLQQGKKS
jgi:hypothetical protein